MINPFNIVACLGSNSIIKDMLLPRFEIINYIRFFIYTYLYRLNKILRIVFNANCNSTIFWIAP